MQKRFRRAYTALREHSCVSYAKIATIGGFCDLDHIVTKATSPDDLPLPERYIRELLKIFSFSPSSFRAFSLSFTRRFGKTRCWRVALKCLLLLHRLLRSLPENSPLRSDLLWSRSNGLISLYPCHFRDSSSSNSDQYTFFIRSYARLIDEALDYFSIDSETNEKLSQSLSDKMKEVSRVLDVLPQLQSLIDRVMECKPIGSVARSLVVCSAMKQIIRDSFVCYAAFCRDVVVVLDNLFQMQYRSSIAAFGIYKRAAVQANQLCEFYEWCKEMGLCGSYEYPFIDRIPHINVQALESFLDGMWQLTESSSSEVMSEVSPSSSMFESSTLTEYDGDKQLVRLETVISTKWERFEGDDEEEPLIQLEMNNDLSWEALLEASAARSHIPRDNLIFCPGYENGYGYGNGCRNDLGEASGNGINGWKMQIYNPNALNPFYHSYIVPNYYGICTSNHMYPWGL